MLFCPTCPRPNRFANSDALEAHLATIHYKCFPYSCVSCFGDQRFYNETLLKDHYRRDHGVEEFEVLFNPTAEERFQLRQIANLVEAALHLEAKEQSGGEDGNGSTTSHLEVLSSRVVVKQTTPPNFSLFVKREPCSYDGGAVVKSQAISTANSGNNSTNCTVGQQSTIVANTHSLPPAIVKREPPHLAGASPNKAGRGNVTITPSTAPSNPASNTPMASSSKRGDASRKGPTVVKQRKVDRIVAKKSVPTGGKHSKRTQVSVQCKVCKNVIVKRSANLHISAVHLKLPMLECRLCGLTSTNFYSAHMYSHLRKAHNLAGCSTAEMKHHVRELEQNRERVYREKSRYFPK